MSWNKGRIPWNKGRTGVYSPDVLERMSTIKKGKIYSADSCKKRSIALSGKKRSDEAKKNYSISKMAQNNPEWEGDNPLHMTSLHEWVRNHYPKPNYCQTCNEKPPYDLANISLTYNPETYNRKLKNWRWLCRRCHMLSDGRMENLRRRSKRISFEP